MVNINTNIPLMAQNPDLMGAMQRGTQNALAQANMMQMGERRNLFQEHGAGIAAGDQNAMNALAAIDPQMAFEMNQQRAAGRRADAQLGMSAERLQMVREQTARSLAEAEDQQAAQREAQDALKSGHQAIAAYQAGDQRAWAMMTREFTGGQPLPMSAEGVAALQSIVTGSGDFLSMLPEQKRQIDLLPAMIYHGVRTEEAVLMRMNGVPRSIAGRLGEAFSANVTPSKEGSGIQKVRSFLESASIETWNRARPSGAPLSGQEYQEVWKVIGGEGR